MSGCQVFCFLQALPLKADYFLLGATCAKGQLWKIFWHVFSNINLASFVKIASSSFSDVLLLQWRLQTVNKSASFTSYYSQVTWTWMWLPWLCQATLTKSRPCGERCAALWGCSWRTPTSASCLPFSPVSLEPTMACWYWISLISRTFER